MIMLVPRNLQSSFFSVFESPLLEFIRSVANQYTIIHVYYLLKIDEVSTEQFDLS